jgi:ribonuclease Y
MIELILPVAGLILGAVLGTVIATQRRRRGVEMAEDRAGRALREAERLRNASLEEARAEAQELIGKARSELEERRDQIKESEERITERNEVLNRKSQSAADLLKRVTVLEDNARALRDEVSEIDRLELNRLSEISGLSVDQAGKELLQQIEKTLREDAQVRVRDAESDVRERADEISRRLLADTMQRIASPVVSQSPGSSVPLTERDLRKVKSAPQLLEQVAELTGVTLTVKEDETALSVSASDAVRRELARLSITDVLKAGRTSPNDIERLVRKQEQRLEKSIREEGVAAARRAGVGRLPAEVINALGKLQFRYSYGQNQLIHAVETAHLAAMLAHEMGADVEIARAGGLLHDLGKAIDRDVEGTHAQLGGQLALDAGIDPRIAHCISAHHEEVEPETTEALITIVADAMSGARPGARRESLDNYLARLQAIEAVANDFPGVEKCYAIQAGRELRVIVNPDTVDDLGATRIAQAISERIQSSLEYPGQIKVMVIRETRTVEHSR